jgi:hypothetical protein
LVAQKQLEIIILLLISFPKSTSRVPEKAREISRKMREIARAALSLMTLNG